jgi:hypothetical protein
MALLIILRLKVWVFNEAFGFTIIRLLIMSVDRARARLRAGLRVSN